MLRNLLLISFLCYHGKSLGQDISKLKQIDSIVTIINQSNFNNTIDSVVSDDYHITKVMDGIELIKYVMRILTRQQTNGVFINEWTESTSFYFDHNHLIKVEEVMVKEDKKNILDWNHSEVNWYYMGDKPLYYSLQLGNSEQRAKFLLTLSKDLVKTVNGENHGYTK